MTKIALHQLDARIASHYVDAWGKRRVVAPSTLAALAQALGAVKADEGGNVQVHRISAGPIQITVPLGCCRWTLQLDSCALLVQSNQHGGLSQKESAIQIGSPSQVDGLDAATLTLSIPLGYHLLTFFSDSGERQLRLIGVPDQCYLPQAVARGKRSWGMALQLYTLRSARNWGIGDFTDLREFVAAAAGQGVDIVGLNPLHALYPANAFHISPYSPSHREYLNWLYLDVEAIPELALCAPARELMATDSFSRSIVAARETGSVDYYAVAGLKRPILERLFQSFRVVASPDRQHAFAEFVQGGGADLQRHALFDAVQEHFFEPHRQVLPWQQWPLEYQDPASESSRKFACDHADRLSFFCWLQWLAETQLEAAQQECRRVGMRIGLYRDLAVGADRGGSEIWRSPDLFCQALSVGAPPDAVAVQGQNWGLPPLHPDAIQRDGYRRFAAMLRANMRHCGALRIDHVMALFRLWWIPPGGCGTDGAYVHYPLADMAGIVALESQRQQCMVIGEDLGTVPEEIRHLMADNQMLSYRVLMFEQHPDRLKAPCEYPALALASISTHDMPTLPGFWQGDDITLRDRLELFDSPEQAQQQYEKRHADKQKLIEALIQAGLYQGEFNETMELTDRIVLGSHVYLARSSAAIMMCQPEDWFGERRQVNLPGTSDEYANWQRKLAVPVEQMFDQAFVRELCQAVSAARQS